MFVLIVFSTRESDSMCTAEIGSGCREQKRLEGTVADMGRERMREERRRSQNTHIDTKNTSHEWSGVEWRAESIVWTLVPVANGALQYRALQCQAGACSLVPEGGLLEQNIS
jgi:hypothetical protein